MLIADGGEAICDIDVLRDQGAVFGPVASDNTVWRALDEIGTAQLRRIAVARAKVRARLWQLFGGPPAARVAGRDVGAGVVVLDVDSTILIVHSDKENAGATYKHTYGFHPILVTCDNTNEMLTIKLRPGNAGANTAADLLTVLTDAADLIAWLQTYALGGDLATAEPKRLRYRLLHTAARLTHGQRRRWLRIPATWPWANQLSAAVTRITAIPAPG